MVAVPHTQSSTPRPQASATHICDSCEIVFVRSLRLDVFVAHVLQAFAAVLVPLSWHIWRGGRGKARCLWMFSSTYEILRREGEEREERDGRDGGEEGRNQGRQTGYAVHAPRTRMELFRHSFDKLDEHECKEAGRTRWTNVVVALHGRAFSLARVRVHHHNALASHELAHSTKECMTG